MYTTTDTLPYPIIRKGNIFTRFRDFTVSRNHENIISLFRVFVLYYFRALFVTLFIILFIALFMHLFNYLFICLLRCLLL